MKIPGSHAVFQRVQLQSPPTVVSSQFHEETLHVPDKNQKHSMLVHKFPVDIKSCGSTNDKPSSIWPKMSGREPSQVYEG